MNNTIRRVKKQGLRMVVYIDGRGTMTMRCPSFYSENAWRIENENLLQRGFSSLVSVNIPFRHLEKGGDNPTAPFYHYVKRYVIHFMGA